MKIIIVGCGRTGSALVKALTAKKYDVTVIEKQKELIEAITDRYSVNGIVGSGASRETLLKAGADSADILIAVTPVDEINLLSCVEAKAVGVKYTVSRVDQPDFAANRKEIEKEHNIDYILNPSYAMAEIAAHSIGFPSFVKSEGSFLNDMGMITLSVTKDSPILDKKVMTIKRELDADLVISFVLRGDKVYIPKGDFVLCLGDRIGLIGREAEILGLLQKMGIVRNAAKKVMIMGGGVTTKYLIDMLLKDKKNITVIESNLNRCKELMEKYPSIHVSYGEGEMDEIFEDEKLEKTDAYLSLTDSDETNLVTSMYAWSRSVPSILTRINALGTLPLLHKINLDIILSYSEIAVSKVIDFIKNIEVKAAENDIEKYMAIANNKAELLLFTAKEGFKKMNMPFKDVRLNMKKNTLVIAIYREGELILPKGDNYIQKGDLVTVVTDSKNHIESLNDVFN